MAGQLVPRQLRTGFLVKHKLRPLTEEWAHRRAQVFAINTEAKDMVYHGQKSVFDLCSCCGRFSNPDAKSCVDSVALT